MNLSSKVYSTILTIIIISTLFSCVFRESKIERGIYGFVKDEDGNLLEDVSISFESQPISTITDSLGNYSLNTSKTLLVKFKKEGYQTHTTIIDSYVLEGNYDLKTITLKKGTDSTEHHYPHVNDNKYQHKSYISGRITTINDVPIKHAKITLIDNKYNTTTTGTKDYNKGYFYYVESDCNFTIRKKGFRDLQIKQRFFDNKSTHIRLLETSKRKGVYLINASNNYIALPKAKLPHHSISKEGVYLWVFAGRYGVTDYFYPSNKSDFKIKKDTLLRFAIFNPEINRLCKVTDTSNYLCTVKYKYWPAYTKGNFVEQQVIYPSELCENCDDEPSIIEITPDSSSSKYVFINPVTQKGYYFNY